MRLLLPLMVALAVLISESSAFVVSSKEIPKSTKRNPLKTADGKAICTTTECVIAASNLIQAMDLTADPCEDFFQYSCGGWIQKNPIPDSKSRWTEFDVLRDELTNTMKDILKEVNNPNDAKPVNQARDFYTACLDTNTLETLGLKPLTDLLGLFGGWPMTLSNWNAANFDWKVATAAGRKLYGVTYLLTIYNYLDSHNTAQSSIFIDQGSLALSRTTLVNPGSYPEIMTAYANYATGAAKAIRDSLGQSVPDATITSDVDAMWKFESELAKITSPAEDRRNNTRLYNPLLLTEVQGWTDSVSTTQAQAKIDWSAFLNDIYSAASITIPNSERVIVVETEYLKKLVALLDVTPARTLANYVHWRFVNSLGSYTTQQMRDLAFAFNKVLYGTTTADPRTTTCANQANDVLGYAVSAKYVERSFDEIAKTETELMIKDLKTAFKTLVDEAAWMDSTTKGIAREKVDFISEFVAYPDWIKNKTALETYYNGVQFHSN